ncbi:hypothetical protein [Nocardia fluminea]|uniref:hypothetical protein n=1 Tax=Nocardia fluminea TaxID=134984 RepID=UPI00365ED9D8
MTVDFVEPQPSDDDQEHPLGADRIAAMVTDLPPLTPEMPNAAIPFEAQAADMVQEMLYAIENQLDVVDSQISAHTDGNGRLVCWTEQRVDTWDIARTTQQHVPTWATAREDRRPLYAMMSNAMILRGLISAGRPGSKQQIGQLICPSTSRNALSTTTFDTVGQRSITGRPAELLVTCGERLAISLPTPSIT